MKHFNKLIPYKNGLVCEEKDSKQALLKSLTHFV